MTEGMLAGLFALAAAGSPGFDAVAASARPIAALDRFLDDAVGRCATPTDPRFDRRGCLAEARRRRRAMADDRWRLDIRGLRGRLDPPVWDRRRRAWRVLLTPIFGERGLGLSVGRPSRVDRAGRPVVRKVPLWVRRPDDLPEFIFRRDLERGKVTLRILVTVGERWSFGRGERAVEGLSVRLVGWQLVHRSGVLGERVLLHQNR